MDLNADVGEGAGSDAQLLAVVTSASVACGAHAGSTAIMRATVEQARDLHVAIGAHPGYPDRRNFGRNETGATPEQIERWIGEQLHALLEICRAAGVRMRYVKPHGALYNRAVRDKEAAAAIAAAAATLDSSLMVLALPNSAMLAEAVTAGLRVAREAFLDRAYAGDGTLAPRSNGGAIISDINAAASRAVRIARGDSIEDSSGKPLLIAADSLCIHGDSPGAVEIARVVRERLQEAGITLSPFAM